MKVFIKLLLVSAIAVFAMFNYRFISFNKGISKTSMDDMKVQEALMTMVNVTKVEYYQMPFTKDRSNDSDRPGNYQSDDYIYRVYIETANDAYLLKATQDDINAFSALGLFSKKFAPQKVTPIPYYVDIIVAVIILVIPFGRRKKQEAQ